MDGEGANKKLPISCLALDIGGVFYADVWETVFEKGLAAHLGISLQTVMMHGAKIWDDHGHRISSENEYWQSWETILGQALDRDLIASLIAEHVWVDRSVADVIDSCLERCIDVCFVSNSTNFWFRQQMARSGLEKVENRIVSYLSHDIGYPKTHSEGGLAKLAADRDPTTVLFVDDRKSNIDKAMQIGMQTMLYERTVNLTLAQALEGRLLLALHPPHPKLPAPAP